MIQTPISARQSADMDSLLAELKKQPDSCRLRMLYDLTYENLRSRDFKNYSDLLLKEAVRQRNDVYKASALFLMGMYYYSVDADSMFQIVEQAEPLLLAQKRIEEACRMHGWTIYGYTRERQNEKVLPAVEHLKALARKYNYPDGIDMANQALADYYVGEGLKDEGLELYEEVFRGMEKRDVPVIKRIHIIRQLINKHISSEKQFYYLDKLNGYIRDCEAKGQTQMDAENPLYMIRYFYHRSYAMLGIQIQNAALTRKHLAQAEKIVMDEGLEREKITIKHIRVSYLSLVGNHEQALKLNEELVAYYEKSKTAEYLLEKLNVKANLLMRLGRGMEAARIYNYIMQQKDSIRKSSFYEDLAKLRARHDMDKLELKTKEMELQAEKTHSQLLVMGGGLVLTLIGCCLLFFIARARHRYGLQLKVAKEKAEETDRLKSAFLANMNHEIRTPLNAIVGFSQVLIEEDDKTVRAELAEIIQNNNELLQRLIADVLDISKIESNSMDFRYAELPLPALMKEIYSTLLLRMPEGVELVLEECQPMTMDTDRNRLTQVLTNLLTNALKHTAKGSIRFGYQLSDTRVRFFVQDTGSGIPEEEQARIFSRFVQLDSWHKGVGLGLAICKGLVEKMGGSISVESEVGVGSTFYVDLPLRGRIECE